MAAQAHRAQLLLETLATTVMWFDAELRLRAVNPAGEALLAASTKKVLGASAEELFPASEHCVEVLRAASAAQQPLTERGMELHRPDLETLTVDCTVTPLADPRMGPGLVVELVQIDRHQGITAREQSLAQYEVAHTMIRGLAHEIRNPLGGLRGAAQLLERELDDPGLREYTSVIIHEADRLQKLMDRLLGPRRPPRKRPTNIHEITDRVCTLVRAEVGAQIQLVCDYDPSLPELEADPDMLIQAVLNIVRNAVQAIGTRGEIRLRTRVARKVNIGLRRYRLAAQLDVFDDGPGITPDLREKIFYPMVSGRPDGTGMGLPIAQSLVHQHGGLIQCRSRPGKTVMTLLFPLENGT